MNNFFNFFNYEQKIISFTLEYSRANVLACCLKFIFLFAVERTLVSNRNASPNSLKFSGDHYHKVTTTLTNNIVHVLVNKAQLKLGKQTNRITNALV